MTRPVALALALATATLAGCSLFQRTPEEPARIADRLRLAPVPYEQLQAAAARGPARNVLWLRETYMAELQLGATPKQVRQHWGEPTRVKTTAAGTWWEFDEVYPKPGATPEPIPSGQAPDERSEPNVTRVGMNLRLLFVGAPPTAATPPPSEAPVAPSAEPGATPTPRPAASALPGLTLAHIQAWAPARFQTRTLVRVLDLASRVERKYGRAPRILPWGRDGAEAWIYPAANVAFVVTPGYEEQPRYVAGTLVGF